MAGNRTPAAVRAELAGESRFPIQAVNRRLDVRHDGLDLVHGNDPRAGMKCEHIHRAPLATDRERNFDRDLPTCGGIAVHKRLDDLGVALIQEAVEPFGAPARNDVDLDLELAGDRDDRVERHSPGLARLEAADRAGRNAGAQPGPTGAIRGAAEPRGLLGQDERRPS